MELKDLILQTLNEFSQPSEDSNTLPTHQNISIQTTPTPPVANPFWQNENIREECEFLEMLQERLLVLFEGLCAEHNQDIQTKLNPNEIGRGDGLTHSVSIISKRGFPLQLPL